MKKALVVAGLALTLGSVAQAQTVSAGGTFFSPGGFGVNFAFATPVADLGATTLSARVGADVVFAAGATGFGLNIDGLFNFPAEGVNLYAGPSVGFAGVGNAGALKVGAVAGLSYNIDAQFGVFGEGFFNFVGGMGGGARLGVTYRF